MTTGNIVKSDYFGKQKDKRNAIDMTERTKGKAGYTCTAFQYKHQICKQGITICNQLITRSIIKMQIGCRFPVYEAAQMLFK